MPCIECHVTLAHVVICQISLNIKLVVTFSDFNYIQIKHVSSLWWCGGDVAAATMWQGHPAGEDPYPPHDTPTPAHDSSP